MFLVYARDLEGNCEIFFFIAVPRSPIDFFNFPSLLPFSLGSCKWWLCAICFRGITDNDVMSCWWDWGGFRSFVTPLSPTFSLLSNASHLSTQIKFPSRVRSSKISHKEWRSEDIRSFDFLWCNDTLISSDPIRQRRQSTLRSILLWFSLRVFHLIKRRQMSAHAVVSSLCYCCC